MSLEEYTQAQKLIKIGFPFNVMLMACMLTGNSTELRSLNAGFPELFKEVVDRRNYEENTPQTDELTDGTQAE